MLKYGIYAKAVGLLCFKPALGCLSDIYPDMDMIRKKLSMNTKLCF